MKKIKMLKKNYEFKKVLSKGKYYGGKQIEAFIQHNNLPNNMLGIAISKKIGKAFIRNKIKRLVRENYRLLDKDVVKGYSIVFLWKKKVPYTQASFIRIREDMIEIFKNANIILK